ncbi:MAG: YitT family protein [Culicoidibacterales bacterium]
MTKLKSETLIHHAKNTLLVLVGAFLVAVSINFFFAPYNIIAGGVSGLAILIEGVTNGAIPKAWTLLLADAILLLLGLITLGKSFFFKTALGTLALPLFIALLPTVKLSDDVFLAVIIGSVVSGVGLALVYYGHGSTGGTTVPPMILRKYFKLNVSVGLFLSDSIVVLLALSVFGWQSFFYAIISIAIASILVDYLETGLFRSKAVYIISDQSEEIKSAIYDIFGRGVTYFYGEKTFTEKKTNIILCVVKASELQYLKETAHQIDPAAFVIVTTVSEVRGEGFLENNSF